jgi:hypothetical protein
MVIAEMLFYIRKTVTNKRLLLCMKDMNRKAGNGF